MPLKDVTAAGPEWSIFFQHKIQQRPESAPQWGDELFAAPPAGIDGRQAQGEERPSSQPGQSVPLGFVSLGSKAMIADSEALKLFKKMAKAMAMADYATFFFEQSQLDVAAWQAWLARHRPKAVILLGGSASQEIGGKNLRLSQDHGKIWQQEHGEGFTFWVMPLFHPDYLLSNPAMKRPAWQDMQRLLAKLG